jgi:hypothetical protein
MIVDEDHLANNLSDNDDNDDSESDLEDEDVSKSQQHFNITSKFALYNCFMR